jgi:hypothetical protein
MITLRNSNYGIKGTSSAKRACWQGFSFYQRHPYGKLWAAFICLADL